MLKKLRNAVRNTAMLGLEVSGLAISGSGTALALFFGKLFAAAVLGAFALGIFLRLAGRRKPLPVAPPSIPPWLQLACALLSLVEVALLTEATNLPVRTNQPDFEKINWALVVLALIAMYFIQIRFLGSLLVRRSADRPCR